MAHTCNCIKILIVLLFRMINFIIFIIISSKTTTSKLLIPLTKKKGVYLF
jgi:hypothetical protein